ncbi:hypothetical protein OESDEN_03440 [Oesophagostomum dentatum]|uniref:Uncharacterized protein n=1 Tax=Oesophagostomum dentatum TaxID=61180 RepID=A0A0B1TGD2_OESDE|nr:hypothetical protein OESDEN_03440 [Oesophagostomum dentatum]
MDSLPGREDDTQNQDLLWDSHTDEDLGDLLDFIMKTADPAENIELSRKNARASLLRSIQAFIDLQPGFPCLESHRHIDTLPQMVRLQLIMEDIQLQLDTATLKVYSRRYGKKANYRRQIASMLLIPTKTSVNLPCSYLALMEKFNPVLFNDILSGKKKQLPFPPDNIQ